MLALLAVLASPPTGKPHPPGGIDWVTPISPMFTGGDTSKTGLVWLVLNFLVLMFVLEKLLFSKLRARNREKHDIIKAELERAREAREKAEAMVAQYQTKLDRLDSEIAELQRDAQERTELDRSRILAEAESEAERIRQSARLAGEREAMARMRTIESEIIDQAVAKAEALLKSQLTPADEQGLVNRYIEQVSTAPRGVP